MVKCLWLLLSIALVGCHTIRPLSVPESSILQEVPRIDEKVGLILDDAYKSYISKDRGNPLADPQKYLVGEALTPLTEAYFEQAVPDLAIYENLDDAKLTADEQKADFYVHLKILQFDNTVRLTEQRIDVELAADIYDRYLKNFQTINARGMATGSTFGGGVNRTTSTALQIVLSNLIREIKPDTVSS